MARLTGLWLLAMLTPFLLAADEGLAPQSNLDPLWKAFGKPAASPAIEIRALLLPSASAAGSTVTLKIEGSLESGYYIYSALDVGPDGPGPTRLEIDGAPLIPMGKLSESAPVRSWDPVFSSYLNIHSGTFWIEQEFKISSSATPGHYDLGGVLVYQLCDGKICNVEQKIKFKAALAVR